MDAFKTLSKNKLDQLPATSGVYCFLGKNEAIYIGKAIHIQGRVKNHFLQPTHKDHFFIKKVKKIGFINTRSEIEALLLEASLIKKYQPKFNQVWRDDKNYFYIAIAKNKDRISYVYTTHQPKTQILPLTNSRELVNGRKSNINHIGPFVEGNALKKTLKFLRRAFPYYTSQKHPKNNCTWCHLGLCPGPKLFENPPSPEVLEDLREYKKNIKKLTLILQGKRRIVLNSLKKEMHVLSKEKKFEEALKVRDRISALQYIMAHAKVIDKSTEIGNDQRAIIDDRRLLHSKYQWNNIQKILQKLLYVKNPISKIECYDVSNMQGKQAVGSMVVFVNGAPDKSQYKKFRIRMENKPNDIAMLKEVLTRRLLHPEWGYPEVMLIDGGIAQLNVGIKSKNEKLESRTIKVISIAKGRRELFIENSKQPIPLKNLPQDIYNLIVHLDDEAHRFAITYHKKLRKKALGLDKDL